MKNIQRLQALKAHCESEIERLNNSDLPYAKDAISCRQVMADQIDQFISNYHRLQQRFNMAGESRILDDYFGLRA